MKFSTKWESEASVFFLRLGHGELYLETMHRRLEDHAG
jgi:hypothetical protein